MVRTSTSLLIVLLLAGPTHEAPGGPERPSAERAAARADALPARSLPFLHDLYTFRGDTGTTDVVASFAVRVGALDREDVDGEVRHRFNVTLVLADTARKAVWRADDSVFVSVPRPLPDEHLLHTYLETRAPPSDAIVQRVLMFDAPNPGKGQLYTEGVVIPDYGGSELMLSDIALGLPGREGGWTRGETTLALLPSSHFPGGEFDVYYEVYNLPRGNRYTTEIAFEPIDHSGAARGEAGRTLRVRFFGESAARADGSVGELRHVDAPLERGRYRLTVTVTDLERGVTADRSRVLRVREWSEGATLVSTCPLKPGVRRPGCS